MSGRKGRKSVRNSTLVVLGVLLGIESAIIKGGEHTFTLRRGFEWMAWAWTLLLIVAWVAFGLQVWKNLVAGRRADRKSDD